MSDEKKPVDIKEKREEKAAVKKSKPKKADFYKTIARAINRDPFNFLGDFPKTLHTVELKSGVRLPVKETSPGVVEITEEEMVMYSIIDYCHNLVTPSGKEQYSFTVKEAKEATQFWIAHTKPIPTPKMVRWADEEGYTYRRLPWPLATGETPVFDEMMSRTTNKDALMAFIGSLFVEDADTQQYVWIHGQGQNGKSALTRFLKDALGIAYRALMVPKGEGAMRFWTLNLLDCRLGVFADTNDTDFITGGLFKSLTGGDPIPCEIKGGAQFTNEMNCKFIFLSNSRPSIASEKADMRRLILCEMEEIKCEPDPNYARKLWAEGGYFLSKCLHTYALMCPNNKQIPVNNSEDVSDWVSSVEEEFETFLQQYFVLDKNKCILPWQLQEKLAQNWDRRAPQKQFKEWLERTHRIRKKTANYLPGSPKIYRGLSFLPNTDVVLQSPAAPEIPKDLHIEEKDDEKDS